MADLVCWWHQFYHHTFAVPHLLYHHTLLYYHITLQVEEVAGNVAFMGEH